MIITVEDIRRYRDIAQNIRNERVEIFIRETEELDIIPLLGAEEYDRLAMSPLTLSFILGSSILGSDKLGQASGPIGVILTPEEVMLLNGGQYEDERGCTRRFSGLKAAESYLSYARFVKNHPIQVTPYGVVVKEGDDSSPASALSVAAVAKDSEKIGRQYLADSIRYWRHVEDIGGCCGDCLPKVRVSKRKYYAIGD